MIAGGVCALLTLAVLAMSGPWEAAGVAVILAAIWFWPRRPKG